MTSPGLSLDAVAEAIGRFPDDGLDASRRAALEHLREHGLPTTRNEDWKYTDLSPAADIGNQSLNRADGQARSELVDTTIDDIRESIDADWLVICDGRLDDADRSRLDATGVKVTQLSESAGEADLSAPLSVLNSALLHDGWRIHVSSDADLSKPVGILIIDDAASATGMSQARVEIELASNSAASFIEYHASLGDADHYENSVATVSLADGARANYVRIQDRASNHVQTGRLSVTLGRDSSFNHCAFDFGGALIRNDISVDIASAGSSAVMNGLYLLGGKQHVDNHIRADHLVGPATSQQEYRGILTGSSRGVWNGKAIVHEGADGTDANQANHNLLLSEKAEIDAKPELEIYADDVKCSHGTTIGQLDEQALFYLRTRGLNRHEAQQLLTHAFAQAIVSASPIKSLNEWLTAKIAQRLGDILQEDAA